MVSDGMFNLGGLRLCPAPARDVLLKVLVEDGDGLNFYVNAPRLKKGVSDLPQLRRDALHAQTFVAEVFPGENVDFHECLVITHEVQRHFGRKHDVQALGVSPEETHELEAEVLVGKQ